MNGVFNGAPHTQCSSVFFIFYGKKAKKNHCEVSVLLMLSVTRMAMLSCCIVVVEVNRTLLEAVTKCQKNRLLCVHNSISVVSVKTRDCSFLWENRGYKNGKLY